MLQFSAKLLQFLWVNMILCSLDTDNYLKRKLITRNETINWLKNLEYRNSTSPYCDLCCIHLSHQIVGKNCGMHTMCIYPNNTIGASCRGYINVQLTSEERLALLDVHNSLRNKVAMGFETAGNPGPQPSASNMRVLKWSNELSEIAQRWVSQCIFSHDVCRDTRMFPVGQNLAKGNLAVDNELSLIIKWYEEVNNFDSTEVDKFKFPAEGIHAAGRYTQIIWADTSFIGCARAIFQQSDKEKLFYVEHLVCNYGPTGNIPDQSIYRVGRPCSNCPEGMACSLYYDGLCDVGSDVNVLGALEESKTNNLQPFLLLYLLIPCIL